MPDWFKKFNENSDKCAEIAYELSDLAEAFGATGNAHMCEVLGGLAIILHNARAAMNQAVGKSINLGLKQAQDSSRAVVEAALAGVILGKGADKENVHSKNQ